MCATWLSAMTMPVSPLFSSEKTSTTLFFSNFLAFYTHFTPILCQDERDRDKAGERDGPECDICAFLDHSSILIGCGSSTCSRFCRISQTDRIPRSSRQLLERRLLPDPELTTPDPAKSQSGPDRRYLT